MYFSKRHNLEVCHLCRDFSFVYESIFIIEN